MSFQVLTQHKDGGADKRTVDTKLWNSRKNFSSITTSLEKGELKSHIHYASLKDRLKSGFKTGG